MFNPGDYNEFTYVGSSYDEQTGEASFMYQIQGTTQITFVERITFQTSSTKPSENFNNLLNLLGMVLGLSYYKTAATPIFRITPKITPEIEEYVTQLIKQGLAEFAYRNNLPNLLTPTIIAPTQPSTKTIAPVEGISLVAVGGGSDSIVTSELLKQSGHEFKQIAINPNPHQRNTNSITGVDFVVIQRKLDKKLFELNKTGALNGHVPVTAMNSLIMVCQSELIQSGHVILSNEHSANEATLNWNNQPVNHQWSKSSEAEQLLNAAIQSITGYVNKTFSFLRPFTEIRITKAYAELCEKYDTVITSCNQAYIMNNPAERWCGECDKCRFKALMFARFLNQKRMNTIFNNNPLNNPSLYEKFLPLFSDEKPFECVGEVDESIEALKGLPEQLPIKQYLVTQIGDLMNRNTEQTWGTNPSTIPNQFKDAYVGRI